MNAWGRLVIENHRGKPVPRTLGILLVAGATLSTAVVAAITRLSPGGLVAAASVILIFAVGILDDLAPGGPRGLRAHLRALAEGHVTTGVLKAVVVTGCAVITVASRDPGVVPGLAGVILLSGSANLGNALDVRPGRALKVYAPILVAGAVLAPIASFPALPGVAICSLLALRLDLAERAMLGDGGANLLGFAGGLVLLLTLPDGPVLAGALVVLGLNILAETVGLSTLIGRSRLLDSVDRLGRIP